MGPQVHSVYTKVSSDKYHVLLYIWQKQIFFSLRTDSTALTFTEDIKILKFLLKHVTCTFAQDIKILKFLLKHVTCTFAQDIKKYLIFC